MIKIQGIKRTSERMEIEVDSFSLMEACKEGLSNKHLSELLKDKVLKIICGCSPDLQDRAVTLTEMNGEKLWMVEDGYDAHKNETLLTSVRPATEQELGLLNWCDSFKDILDFHDGLTLNKNKGENDE